MQVIMFFRKNANSMEAIPVAKSGLEIRLVGDNVLNDASVIKEAAEKLGYHEEVK